MSLSPEGMRRLVSALRKRYPDLGPFTVGPFLGADPANVTVIEFDAFMPTGVFRLGPPPRRSAERMKDAVDWRIARAETRKIIERMVQA